MESTEKKPCCCCSTEEPAADTVSPADVPDAVPSCCRHKDRSPEEYKALVNRLSRIEGQVRGVRGMLEKDSRTGRKHHHSVHSGRSGLLRYRHRRGLYEKRRCDPDVQDPAGFGLCKRTV